MPFDQPPQPPPDDDKPDRAAREALMKRLLADPTVQATIIAFLENAIDEAMRETSS
jgi:hypothetical protein